MGREARCNCRWGNRTGNVTALLESNELIVRGDVRARTPLSALERVDVRGDTLEFSVAGESIALDLGAVVARRWAVAIVAPLPGLTRKLGITPATRLHLTGTMDDGALRAAVADAAEIVASPNDADLAIVRADDEAVLKIWADAAAAARRTLPVWIVYLKGRAAPLGERRVRDCMRSLGYVDTKVAAVSELLTALRFNKTR